MAFKKFTVIAPFVDLHGGEIELTAAQAKYRAGSLTLLKDGRFAINKPLQFKKGEVVGLDEHTPGKGMEAYLAPAAPVPAAPPRAAGSKA